MKRKKGSSGKEGGVNQGFLFSLLYSVDRRPDGALIKGIMKQNES